MPLPPYKQNLTLEEALVQFDYATSQLVLHPFNGDSEDIEKRREHVSNAARDSYLAASRWYEILEKEHKTDNLDRKMAQKYLENMYECLRVLNNKIIKWYYRLEAKETKALEKIERDKEKDRYVAQLKKLKGIQRENNLIKNYVSLIGVINLFVRAMADERHDDEVEPEPTNHP